jgi:hypothetical protein
MVATAPDGNDRGRTFDGRGREVPRDEDRFDQLRLRALTGHGA